MVKMPEQITGINPKDHPEWTRFKVRDNGTGDCIVQEKRDSKNGKFYQNALSLYNLKKEEVEIRFLTNKDTNALSKHYGENSESWINHWIELKDKPTTRLNPTTGVLDTFHNAEIRCSGCDADVENNVTGEWS